MAVPITPDTRLSPVPTSSTPAGEGLIDLGSLLCTPCDQPHTLSLSWLAPTHAQAYRYSQHVPC